VPESLSEGTFDRSQQQVLGRLTALGYPFDWRG
jgi:hypothetical protein